MGDEFLPSGWSKTTVGNYLYVKNGYAFKSTSYVEPTDSTYPVIRISELDGFVATDHEAVHVEDGVEGFELELGDLLIAMSGTTTGKVGIYGGNIPAYQNQRVGNLKLHSPDYGNEIFRNYLISYLSSEILKIAYGGAQPNISGKAIEQIPIQLPPLPEQKVIADKLNTLLAKVENTKARLARIPQILKRFRQSVLAAAVSGKLTNTTAPEEWIDATVSDVIKLKNGFVFKSRDYVPENGIPVVRISDINESGVKSHTCTQVARSSDMPNFIVEKGDLLVAMSGATTGKMGTYHDDAYALQNQRVGNLKIVQPDLITPVYRDLYFYSQRDQILKDAYGGAQPNISGKAIEAMAIRLPPIDVQTTIGNCVGQLFAYTDTIENQVNGTLARVERLTQSILAKAFRGELTEQWRKDNPGLISGDNSAQALLERIQAERATAKPAKRRGRKQVST